MAIRPKKGRLIMKEGAYYEDKRGRTRGPLGHSGSTDYPWRVIDAFGSLTFTEFGRVYSSDVPSSYDLVREVPAPSAPEAPKPEVVTITQEMVDRAILDAVKAGNPAWADEINHAWLGMLRVLNDAS